MTEVLLLCGVVLFTGACASDWASRPTHYASGDHALFSWRHLTGSPAGVTTTDVEQARTQGWWGLPISVSSAEILRN